MTPSKQYEIEWSCQQLLNRVAHLLDKADWDNLSNCYSKDAVLFRPSDAERAIVGRDAIKASFINRPERVSCHLIANTVFDVENENLVKATSRVLLLFGEASKKFPVNASSKLLAGTFNDTLVYLDKKWMIKERKGSIELSYDYSNTD